MTKRSRRNHSPAFKAKVALAALKGKRPWLNWRNNMTFI
jgi:transposase-like protein